jgi:membrane protein EpsK
MKLTTSSDASSHIVTDQPAHKDFTTRKQVGLNVISSFFLLGLKSVVGIWFTKYLIDHLGIGVYGLVPLALVITSYMSVVTSALNYAVGRYFTIELRSGDVGMANRTFNTALGGTMVAVCLLLVFVIFVSYWSPVIFDVPPGHESEARWLFGMVMGAYLFGILRSIFSLSAFANNRLDIDNWGQVLEVCVRILVVVGCFAVFAPTVWQIGLGAISGAFLSFVVAIVVWKWLTPEIKVNRVYFDRHRLRPLLGTSGWIVLSQAGNLLLLSIDLVIVNVALGAEASGRYGSILQWSILLRTLAITMSGVLKPIALDFYARGQMNQLQQLMRQSVKLMGLALALPVGVLVVYAGPLLELWLGAEFASLRWLFVVLIIHLSISLAVLPLFHLQVTLNRAKSLGIVTAVAGLFTLLLGIWWAGWEKNGLGVALAGLLVFIARNALFTPIYSAWLLKQPWSTYIRPLVQVLLGTAVAATIGYLMSLFYVPQSWLDFAISCALASGIYGLFVYVFMLDHHDRQLLMRFIPIFSPPAKD